MARNNTNSRVQCPERKEKFRIKTMHEFLKEIQTQKLKEMKEAT